jgi:hypothetical protein
MATIGRLIDWKSNEVDLDSSFLYRLSIDGIGQFIDVPSYILYGSWDYYRRMMESGLVESKTRKCVLPSEFSPVLLMCMVKSMFGLEIAFKNLLSKTACIHALERGGEIGLCNMTTLASIPPFGALWDHCRKTVFEELSVTNAIEQVVLRANCGTESDVEFAVDFVSIHFDQVLENQPNFDSISSQIPAKVLLSIFQRLHKIRMVNKER